MLLLGLMIAPLSYEMIACDHTLLKHIRLPEEHDPTSERFDPQAYGFIFFWIEKFQKEMKQKPRNA